MTQPVHIGPDKKPLGDYDIAWLSILEKDPIGLRGRTLAIVEELAEMQEEINRTEQGQIVCDWKGQDIKTSIKKIKLRKRHKI